MGYRGADAQEKSRLLSGSIARGGEGFALALRTRRGQSLTHEDFFCCIRSTDFGKLRCPYERPLIDDERSVPERSGNSGVVQRARRITNAVLMKPEVNGEVRGEITRMNSKRR